jgi:ELWxxDGT repeat protein
VQRIKIDGFRRVGATIRSVSTTLPGLLAALLMLIAAPRIAHAQRVSVVKDINLSGAGASSSPNSFVEISLGVILFSAWNPVTGRELFGTDGTAEGTVLVKDIFPGTNDSFPSNLTNVNGTLYFAATDLLGGTELFRLGEAGASVTGACCVPLGCSVVSPIACAGLSGRYVGNFLVCNAPGNIATPCC